MKMNRFKWAAAAVAMAGLAVWVARGFPGTMLTAEGASRPATPAWSYGWSLGRGAGSAVINNPNSASMTLTLGAWPSPATELWQVAPVTIAGNSSATVWATNNNPVGTGTIHVPNNAVATITWHCAGESGTISATMSYTTLESNP